jgi:RimJ/RimL family protein N-acetyltransferase
LRREFWNWRGWQRTIPPIARKVLVTLGGADPDNVTLKIAQALQQTGIDELEAVIVIGGSNPHADTLQSEIHTPNIRLVKNATNMPELMAWADLAVSAGGSTCWELAFMGLPALIVILAENQKPVAQRLDAAGVAINMGEHLALAPTACANRLTELANAFEQRAAMSKHGQALVDGNGTTTVVQILSKPALTLRLVQASDCRLIWDWANDITTRAVSFNAEPIPWENHTLWFAAKLADPRCLFYIAEHAATPIGQIRYEITEQTAIVSIGLAPNQRGRGYGRQIIRLAAQQLFKTTQVKLIHAYIKPDNSASVHAFSQAGFSNNGAITVKGQPALDFILQKDNLA